MAFVNGLRIPDLGPGAGYALWGFRAAAIRHLDCPVVIDAFENAFGGDADGALFAIDCFARLLGLRSGRRISLAAPGCCRVTADELSVVAVFAAAQAHDETRRDAHIAWLMSGRAETAAREAAGDVARSFAGAGLAIAAPPVEVSAPRRGARPLLAAQSIHAAGHA